MEEVDAQPTGVSIERTVDVVNYILGDPAFAAEVVRHNKWTVPEDATVQDIAILFLASRYQWAVDLLTLRTETLKRELDGLATQLADLEGRLSG